MEATNKMKRGYVEISVAFTIVAALAGAIIWVYSTIDDKIQPTELKAQAAVLETVKLDEAIKTIKEDNTEIKRDIKTILGKMK